MKNEKKFQNFKHKTKIFTLGILYQKFSQPKSSYVNFRPDVLKHGVLIMDGYWSAEDVEQY